MSKILYGEVSNIWKNLKSRAMSNADAVPRIHDFQLQQDKKREETYPPMCRIYSHEWSHIAKEGYMVICYNYIRKKAKFLSTPSEISIFGSFNEAYNAITLVCNNIDYQDIKFFIAHVTYSFEDINLKNISELYSGIRTMPVIIMIENYYCNFDNEGKNYLSKLDDPYYKNRCFLNEYFYNAILANGYEWRVRPNYYYNVK